MPYSLVLHCVSPSGTVCPEDLQGQKALALFLEELIEKQDAALAAQLHAPRNAKPFTTAILHRAQTDREPRARAATRLTRSRSPASGTRTPIESCREPSSRAGT